MFRFSLVVMFSVISGNISCWVFNNIDYSALRARNLTLRDTDSEQLLLMQRFTLIYPGTKWCGAGNVAEGYDDLGPANETDACCRDHDNCPSVIPPGETRHNLTNNAFYTRLSCKCDDNFRRCLHEANSSTSDVIGNMYFNALSTKCFRRDYPVTGCRTTGGWFNNKCIEYEYDRTGPRLYQWFDEPNY